MYEEYGFLKREELFEMFKLYTEKQLQAIGAGNKELEIACDKGRKACFNAIHDLNKKEKFNPDRRI